MPYLQPMGGLIDRGEGNREIVFLHGWCCHTRDFAPQVEALSNHAHVVVIDWLDRLIARGGSCSFRDICEDLARVVCEHGLAKPVLCGHSMGGFLATYLAKEEMVEHGGVLVLDSALPLPTAIRTQYLGLAERLRRDDYEGVFRQFAAEAFFSSREEGASSEAIVAGMLERPHAIAIDLLEEVCSLEFDESVARIRGPFHVVASEKGVLDLPALQARIPTATGERIASAGHFITLFEATRVNAIANAFLG